MAMSTSPPRRRAEARTSASRVSDEVLCFCRAVDADASISSVLQDERGRTVVRVRASGAKEPAAIATALRARWPLAAVSTVFCALDGAAEVQLVAPHTAERMARALALAARGRGPRLLSTVGWAALVSGLLLHAYRGEGGSRGD